MGPSLRNRPATRERPGSNANDRPLSSTRDHGDHSLIIPSRTSSLHSRITQPLPSTLNIKPNQRTPKTLTHAYMVCGVGREPSQWVRAPVPSQGKIAHMKGAIGQYWLPEILGSSPRLDQDNEIARSLHAAMRVGSHLSLPNNEFMADAVRRAFPMMLKSALAVVSHTVYTIPLYSNRTRHIRSMGSRSACGLARTRSVLRPFETSENGPSRITLTLRTTLTGYHTA